MISPEKEDGNIEYKLKLINKDTERIESLASQMRYRCIEGNSECIYNLGVEDCGKLQGITEKEFTETIETLNKVADKNNYSVTILTEQVVEKDKKIYEVLIRERNDNKYIDIKVAVAGGVDAGKTSLVSVLTTGQKDNGRGLARSHIFNYVHELKTGRTSSIAHQILGFDISGKIVNYQNTTGKFSWTDITQKSSKIISFFDLAGHEKYLRTTILGLTSSFPDICMIIVDANNGIKPMTKEHIFLCITLKIPFIIVISKIDICKTRQNVLKETLQGIKLFLNYPGIRRIPVNIKNQDDIMLSIKNIYTESITPIFQLSSVTGEGMENLQNFLNILPKKPGKTNDENSVEFHIDHIFNVYGFGTVLGGHLISGKVNIGDKLMVGPYSGTYDNITVRSIYCKKTPVQSISSGSYVCLGIKKIDDKINIKKGNVIISASSEKIIIRKFTAKITVLRTHSTTIRVGYEPMCHTYSIRQATKIISINEKSNSRSKIDDDDNHLRNGDTAIVELEFKYHPEFLKIGNIFLLTELKCKIVGEVVSI